MDQARPRVAIAGASGFVGEALLARGIEGHELVGLSRRARTDDPRASWRACDLYSLLDTERALAGCELAVYLVHSMSPSARLDQARFEDLDLVLADNFGRGARRAGVRRIVYLGGLIPEGGELSAHLRSRREVEQALGAHGVPVTALRAGLVVGPEGSSFQILTRLVRRLPVMLLPAWTRTRTQPVALDDVVRLIELALREPIEGSTVHEIGGPDVLTYRDMMKDVAAAMGLRRPVLDVPLVTPGLSSAWVSLITGQSIALVAPLVESLRHEMVARDRSFQLSHGIPGRSWKEMLAGARDAPTPVPAPAAAKGRLARRAPAANVRSIQRLPRPSALSAPEIGREYLRWLPRLLWPIFRVEVQREVARFFLFPLRAPLLVLRFSPERSTADRALFYVDGGLLSAAAPAGARSGRLEFRLAPGGHEVIAALHDFIPRLPWAIYLRTQARVHLWVMWRFGRHLGRLAAP